jgi:predicted GIY-YIG superfamily endonuclease
MWLQDQRDFGDEIVPIVYLATNKVNGKIYIGVTKRTLMQRASGHFTQAKRGVKLVFYDAIRKYGRDSFEFEVLFEFNNYDSALDGERLFIKLLNPDYNVSAGGRGPQGVTWNISRRERTMIGLQASWTEERKRRMSEQNKGVKPSPKCFSAINPDANCRSVVCINDGKLFKGLKYAAEFYGISRKGISEMLSGRQTHVGGFSFIYSEVPLPEERLSELRDDLENRRRAHKKSLKDGATSKRRAVLLVNTGQVFCSGREASQITGVHPSRINQICAVGGKTRAGLEFRYAEP